MEQWAGPEDAVGKDFLSSPGAAGSYWRVCSWECCDQVCSWRHPLGCWMECARVISLSVVSDSLQPHRL